MIVKRFDQSKSVVPSLALRVYCRLSAFGGIERYAVGCNSYDPIRRKPLGLDNQDTDVRDNDHEIRAAISNMWFGVDEAVFTQAIQQIENLPLALIQAVRKIAWEERCQDARSGIVAAQSLF
jgi:hypothetical protein